MFLPWNFLCTQWFKCFTFARSYTFRIKIKSIYRKFWSNPYQNSDKIQQRSGQNTSTTSFNCSKSCFVYGSGKWVAQAAQKSPQRLSITGCSFNASQKDRGFVLEGETELPCSALSWKLPKSPKEFSFFRLTTPWPHITCTIYFFIYLKCQVGYCWSRIHSRGLPIIKSFRTFRQQWLRENREKSSSYLWLEMRKKRFLLYRVLFNQIWL